MALALAMAMAMAMALALAMAMAMANHKRALKYGRFLMNADETNKQETRG